MDIDVRKKEKNHVTKDDVKKGLASVGLAKGDAVLVHSSLSSFGYVESGADSVIDALLETVGSTGTVAVPTFSGNPGDMEIGIKAVFDVANTLVEREIGIIPEVFRKRKEAIRSHHICHSVAAIGPQAEYIMEKAFQPMAKAVLLTGCISSTAGIYFWDAALILAPLYICQRNI